MKSFTEATKVFMAPLTDEEVEAYVESGEPMYGFHCNVNGFVRYFLQF